MADNMIGRTFSGRYRIVERIGIGGMAEVYRAQDTVLGRIVAVKVMLPQYAADADFTRRFRQEAAAAANLQSPYIVNVYDWGQDEGTYYIVMEYVRGGDLKTAIKERGAISQRKVAEIASQSCQALSVAHHMDIVHRDVKPQNIMVQPDGNVKVMDFGIARAKNSTKSQTSSVLGTAHYISPEQAQGKELTAASDIYSLGVCMYEAITGQLPFDGPDAVSVAMKQVNEAPKPLHEVFPGVDPVLEAIVLRAMAKDPAKRFETALDMRQVLNDYLSGRARGSAAAKAILAGEGIVAGASASSTGSHPLVSGSESTRIISPDADQQTSLIGSVPTVPGGAGQSQTRVMPTAQGGMHPQTVAGGGMPPTSYRTREDDRRGKGGKGKTITIVVLVLAILAAAGAFAWYTVMANSSTVPQVANMTFEQGVQELEKAGYAIGETTETFSDDVELGKIISTDPSAGTRLDKGTSVAITLSKGKEQIEVPDVVHWTEKDAKEALTASGLTPKAAAGEHSSEVEKGAVIRTSPAGGTQVDKGSSVTYIISLGPDNKSVPNVVGQSQDAAIANLTNAGFNVSVREDYSDDAAKGLVFDQYPEAGSEVDKGSTVEIVVSRGEEYVDVPNVVGMSVPDAYSVLSNKGFEVTLTNDYSVEAIVTSQSVSGEAKPGSTVNITAREPEPEPKPETNKPEKSSSSSQPSKSTSKDNKDEEDDS